MQPDSGTVTVKFGDGTEGARPPTGQTNVRALYRVGLGLSGNVPAAGINQAIDRPAGLKSVTNPTAATGGADPDTPADARASAPLHVLTLERVVSLQDYQDYSTAFSGIAKALATWTWFGRTRGVVVTVAGPGGAALDPDGETIGHLAASLRASGNPYIPVTVLPASASSNFAIAGLVRIDTESSYDPTLGAGRRAAPRCSPHSASPPARLVPGRRTKRGDRCHSIGSRCAGHETDGVRPSRRPGRHNLARLPSGGGTAVRRPRYRDRRAEPTDRPAIADRPGAMAMSLDASSDLRPAAGDPSHP